MAHEFKISEEITLAATPEQVWEAIATGPGVNSWFMGHSEIEPREGGVGRFTLGGETSESTVTAWEPGRRLATQGETNPDGTFMAFEYLIEGREQGSTVLRFVHSGFLGDNWEAEYDALTKGDRMYLEKLAAYLAGFPGRTSTFNLFLPKPEVPDADAAWAAFRTAFGLSGVASGDRVRLAIDGLPEADGIVTAADLPSYAVARTGDGVHTFLYAFGTVVVEYHNFSADLDEKQAERAWQAWLASAF